MPQRLSLKGRALQLLAQREQSRVELRRKLIRHRRSARAESVSPTGRIESGPANDIDEADGNAGAQHQQEVEAMLDWLEAHRYLCAERFVESRVHGREARYGNLRIRQELAQHGMALSEAAARSLQETELQRAAAVRERRFRTPPANAAERAAQSRFLLGRGFTPEVVHRLMRETQHPSVDSDSGPVEAGS